MRRRRALAVAVACGALIAGAAAYFALPRYPRSASISIPAAELRSPYALAGLAARGASLRPIVFSDGRAALGDGPAGVQEDVRPGEPTWLSIPAVSIEAPIDPVHATSTGVEIPPVGRAGWFEAGPRPGEPGRAVIVGHFDATNGPGLFALLPAVANGTQIAIRDSGGVTHQFEIVGKAEMDKTKFPIGAVFGSSPSPVLVLVTCAGPYTPGVGYRDNVLVYARAVGASGS